MHTHHKELADIAIRAALAAGTGIMRIYDDPSFDLRVEAKEDDSPLTAADREANRLITDRLRGTGIPILSEEGEQLPHCQRRSWSRFWLVDPLDGTKEFLSRNGEFTVNIALVEGVSPILGVVFVPARNLLYCGIKGLGAWRLEGAAASPGDFDTLLEKGCRMPCFPRPSNYTMVGSRSHMNDATRRHLEQRRKQHGRVEMLAVGSALKICLVAEGSAQEYPRLGPTMEWDTAAGQAVAEAAGAKLVLLDGVTPLSYNKEDLRNPHFLVYASAM